MISRSQKLKAANIRKVQADYPGLNDDEAYQLFVDRRYHNPKAKEDRKIASSLGGKASPNRGFKDVEVARKAQRKSAEVRRAKNASM